MMATYRFCFEVRGVSKFLSHLDILKLFNRALMRAGLPVAYSEGFNPHPKISFGPPRGVGIEGLAEWSELVLKEDIAPAEVLKRLNRALPESIQVKSVRQLDEAPHPALMAEINLTCYEAEVLADEAGLAALALAIQRFEQAESWEITRIHPKKGAKQVDLKAGVDKLALLGSRLYLEIPFRDGGSVKPLEVMQALLPQGADYRLARTGLYVVTDGERREP